MGSALVLNATYEPLGVVSARRAVVLVLGEKADLLHASGDEVHSERLTVPVPSVIRLRYVVKVPFVRRAALNRRAVFARDGSRCQYCTAPAESIDHVVPRSRGGEHVWENVVAACRPCNTAKRARSPLPEVRPAAVEVVRTTLPLVTPFATATGTEVVREVLLVRARDGEGREGWGECGALSSPGYTGEWVHAADA